jgi:hypothetical protein
MRKLLPLLLVVVSCGTTGSTGSTSGSTGSSHDSSVDGGVSAGSGGGVSASTPLACANATQLASWQKEIDQFDNGFRPTGSPAHEGYIALLTKELAALGVQDVHTEPYAFAKWTPQTWSLDLTTGVTTASIPVTGYIPYSGATSAQGISAPIVYVPPSALPMSPTAAIPGALAGKIVLFDVPKVALTLSQLTGDTLYINDASNQLQQNPTITRTDLSAMLTMNAVMNALAVSGAVGAVGILDLPEQAARGLYAPFFGNTVPNLPGVYVDRATGASLKSAASGLAAARLVLDASVSDTTSENLVGVLPGASSEEIIVGSHTDGPNSMEDNGPVALLALASCLAPLDPSARPPTIRFVLSGGHFIGSRGLETYVAAHTADLTATGKVVIEVEHLGAREWSEVSPGQMQMTGRPEMLLVSVTPGASLADPAIAFAKQFPRTIVATPPVLGEGQNFRILPLIQLLSVPEYLLVGRLPAVTSQLTDYDLMAHQVAAFIDMEKVLASAP